MARKARKGKRRGRKSARRGRKGSKKRRKSSKRSRAAKKGARTRARKKAAHRRAGKKGARRRKAHRRRSRAAEEPKRRRRSKRRRKAGKRRRARRGGHRRRRSTSRRAHRSDMALKRQLEKARKRLERLQREGKSHRQIEAAARKLRTLTARKNKTIHKQEMQLQKLRAAERGRHHRRHHRKHRRHHHGRKSRRRNPVTGMGEHLAMGAGVVFGALATVIPYRLIKSHPLLQGQGAPNVDSPKQGDVPNLLASSLPVWGGPTMRKVIAIGAFIIGDVALPFGLAYALRKYHKTVTFLETWGWTAIGLGATKLTIDVAAFATKNTAAGLRLFAPENTARSVRTQSAAAQLPPIPVAAGQGLPGLTGYGRAVVGAGGCGGGCGCSKCKGQTGPSAPAGGNSIPTPTDIANAGNPGTAGGNPITNAAANIAAPTGAGGPPPKEPATSPRAGNVTHISNRVPAPRFNGGRFGGSRF